MALPIGSRLGPYEIIGLLGAGGMGEVHRAKDTRLGRDVALKVLPESVATDPDRLARFEREARTVARLSHPNIVVLYSVEHERGVRFLTMELVEGQTLAREIHGDKEARGLPLERVFELAIPLADALAAAHESGVVHRDLKPANVMVTPQGRVKVLDFGLAKWSGPESATAETQTATVTAPLTMTGTVMGSVPYMAPEQIRGEAVDARADLFAFGVVLFEMVTGRRPFGGATAADVSSAILRDPPPPAQTLRADLPAGIGRIIARCLEKAPERRFQTAKDVRNELELARRALESGGAPAAPVVAAAAEAASIAVLPFANRGRDEEDEYFADGITEDVIAQLCKVRTLKVISRSSVMPFRNREETLPDIASRLHVANVLEGSVRRLGDRVRIVAQLIDAASGRHLWAETYDRRLTDIFAIQSEVALHIAGALEAELSPDERQRIRREPTRDVEAYELYQRGRHSYVGYTPEDITRSIEYFEDAIRRDPNFALAYVGIATAYTELGEVGVLSRAASGPRAMAAARKAVKLDPELGEAQSALAFARLAYEFDWEGADAGFKRALELSPGSAEIRDLYGRMCAGIERFDEAIALHERAYELDPVACRTDLATSYLRAGRNADAENIAGKALAVDPEDPRPRATFGWALYRQGRVDEGLAELERAATLRPTEDMWRAQYGQALALAGRTEEARAILQQMEEPSRPSPASNYNLAYLHIGLGDFERAMDCLERAFEVGTGALYAMKGSFLLAPLRRHPRFVALLRKMRLE